MKKEMPSIFGSAQEEMDYINSYFGNFKNSEYKQREKEMFKKSVNPVNSEYKPITLTKKEIFVLVQSIRYNDNFVMPFIAEECVIMSLHKKGFVEKENDKEMFKVKKNVCLLFEIEGEQGFDEIIEECV